MRYWGATGALALVVGLGSGGLGCDPDPSLPNVDVRACNQPLANDTGCESTFEAQVASHPCTATATGVEGTCGRYHVWSQVEEGGRACYYDMSLNGQLVASQLCAPHGPIQQCPSRCITFGMLATYLLPCNSDSRACPP